MTTTSVTRSEVERIVREAREKGDHPNLRGADLRDADLSEADLREVDLRWANLRWADLHRADLGGADLRWADLRGADLRDADLSEANLHGVRGVIPLGCTPSGYARMAPLPNGTWRLTVGCWGGTTAELRTLIAGEDWPDATGPERDRRRPILAALADLADAQATYHAGWLTAVVKRWGDKETDQ